VLGYRVNPAAALSPQVLAHWQAMGTGFIHVNRSRSGHGRDEPLAAQGAVCVEDVDNRLGPWFEAARSPVVVIRPDRFVAAVATGANLTQTMEVLSAQIRAA
jgi:3-(3-hydroxy-phenyl)propionate hydroxylase